MNPETLLLYFQSVAQSGKLTGSSAKESVLNSYNQVWGAPNVFCTDGAAMVSSGCQNPSLTNMALSARAVDFAVSELKKGNL